MLKLRVVFSRHTLSCMHRGGTVIPACWTAVSCRI